MVLLSTTKQVCQPTTEPLGRNERFISFFRILRAFSRSLMVDIQEHTLVQHDTSLKESLSDLRNRCCCEFNLMGFNMI